MSPCIMQRKRNLLMMLYFTGFCEAIIYAEYEFWNTLIGGGGGSHRRRKRSNHA